MPKRGIRLWRFVDGEAIYRSFEVFIDGERYIENLTPNDGHLDIELSPGQHIISVKMDWCRSPAVPVLVKDRLVSLTIRATRDRLIGMLFRPNYYFQIAPSPPGDGMI